MRSHCAFRSRNSAGAAEEAAGERAGELVVGDGLLAGHERRQVAARLLHEPSPLGGQVERHARRAEAQPLVVDHVEIGPQSGCHEPTIAEAVQLGRLVRLAVHHVLERQPRTTGAVAGPVGEHERRCAAVADRTAVGAGIAQPHPRVRVQCRLVRHRQVAVRVVEERRVEHAVAVVGEQLVEHELHRRRAGAGRERSDRLVAARFVVDVAVGDRPDAAQV
eukprot:gene20924-40851_t